MKKKIVMILLLLSTMLGAIGLPALGNENNNTDEIGKTSILVTPNEHDMNGVEWAFDEVENKWCTDFPAVPVNDALVWTTEITDAYEAYLTFTHEYDFESYTGYEAKGYVELSADGGETWHVLGVYEGTDGPVQESFKLTYWAGNDILVHFRTDGDGYYGCSYD